MDTLTQLTRKIDVIPTLPQVYYTVSSLLENPKVSASDISTAISRDPVITARILKIVNSAFYGLPRQVSTLTHALVLLGFHTVRSLVMAMGLSEVFPKTTKSVFPRDAFWTHCFAAGTVARNIARRLDYPKGEEIFIQGLLHDVGKIILDCYMQEEFTRAIGLARERNILLLDAEREVFGFTHADVGELVTHHWNLPDTISRAIGMHHRPAEAGDMKTAASILHLADIVCRARLLGDGGDAQIPALDPEAWQTLHLDWKTLDAIMGEADGLKDCGAFF